MSDIRHPRFSFYVKRPRSSSRIFARRHPLVAIDFGAGFREFIREPGPCSGMFAFPILLAAGLGQLRFATVRPRCSKSQLVTPELAQSCAKKKLLDVSSWMRMLRKNRYALGRWRYSQSLGPTAQWCISMTIQSEGRAAQCLRIELYKGGRRFDTGSNK